MVGFNDVVQVLVRSVLCGRLQLAFLLQPADGFWIGAELIGGDRRRRLMTHGCQRSSKEMMSSSSVAAVCQHEIDQTAMLVNGPEQILPLAAHPNLRLIDAP